MISAIRKTIASRLTIRRLRRTAVAGVLLLACGLGGLLLAVRVVPFPMNRVHEMEAGGSALILTRDGSRITWRVDAEEAWRLPVPVAAVAPDVLAASVAAEDQRYYDHGGIDPLAVARAVRQNIQYRRRVSGASTITMQCMRLVKPKSRTISAKLEESFRALQIETRWDKDRILQLYVNRAPYGGNVIGIEAAARRFFNKSASALTLGESALLAGLPQRPAAFNPEKHLDRALQRRNYVLQRMKTLELADAERIQTALREPILLAPAPQRIAAPHFADYLLQTYRNEGGSYQTTLDPYIQSEATDVLTHHGEDLAASGIDGAAVVVIDIKKSALRAMVGGYDPDNGDTGMINGAAIARQPGSLLKPFLFAAAYQDGLLTPNALVYDIPSSWNGYAPENMDRKYMGPLSAGDALRYSRNIPAVRLLDTLTPARLVKDAQTLGLPLSGQAERCGLSLALGTAEVNLVQISNAYAALARLGAYQPLRLLATAPRARPVRAFTREAAWLTLRSLADTDRTSPVWKTGTSWRHRDAWCVMVTPRYVVGVWCGRHSGEGHPRLTGAVSALPIALDVMQRIDPDAAQDWPRPHGLARCRVCSLSGAPAASACIETRLADTIPGVTSQAPCRLHQFSKSGEPEILWPSDVRAFQASREDNKNYTPQIRFPLDGAEYILAPTSESLLLQPVNADSQHYWFLNDKMIAHKTGAISWQMTPGTHTLTLSDDNGTSHRIRFSVRKIIQ